MKGQKEDITNLPKNASPVCYQNDPDIQEEYLLSKSKIKKTKKIKQSHNKKEDQ